MSFVIMRVARICLLSLAPLLASNGSVYLIIVDGDQDPQKAQQKLDLAKRKWPASVLCTNGEPSLHESGRIAGLNPGFWIITAGACSDQRRANAIRKELNRVFPGTYLRLIAKYWPVDMCPQLKGVVQAVPGGFTLQKNCLASKREGLRWQIYAKNNKPCDGNSILVRLVDASGKVLDEDFREAECRKGNGEEDLGSQLGWSCSESESKDGSLALVSEAWAADTPFKETLILKAVDGHIACSPVEENNP